MKKIFFLWCLWLCAVTPIVATEHRLPPPCHFNELPLNEQQSLTNLYNATNGNNWERNDNWFSPAPLNEWWGLQVLSDECHITEIKLDGNQLTGNIPANLQFDELHFLRLDHNDIVGSVPNFANLPQLRKLDLSHNELTGTIPDFDNVPQLEDLYLQENNLTGQLPNFTSMAQLEWLFVGDNQLTGLIPDFDNLPNLVFLEVCPNNFVGNLPSFDNCPQLHTDQIDFSCAEQALVSGTVFYDANANCQLDANEATIPNLLISSSDSSVWGYSNNNGYYQMGIGTDLYVVQALLNDQLFWQNTMGCPAQYSLQADDYTDVIPNINFALSPVQLCPLPTVSISTQQLRRCFETTYQLTYCNEGTAIAESAEVVIDLPASLQLLSASATYTLTDGQYHFFLGNLAIGQCGNIALQVLPDCNAPLGSAACVQASIYPPSCLTAGLDGYQLSVKSECANDSVRFSITNLSDTDMPAGTEYRLYEDDILSALGTVQLLANQIKTVHLPANGTTYRLIADANSSSPIVSHPQAFSEGCGGYSLGYVLPFAPPDNEPFIDIDCHPITGSFDPNDLQAQPIGLGSEHYILPNTPLNYTIRFQNTGNDTAIHILVIDTLDAAHFDLSTLRLGNSSHPYQYEIIDNKALQINFNNIYLPDSNANQAASNGYLTFSIQPKASLAQSHVIANQSYLFFDYNPPIATNTVTHTICTNTQTLCQASSSNIDSLQFSVGLNNDQPNAAVFSYRLYPNPSASGSVFFEWLGAAIPQQNLQLSITNMLGQTVYTTHLPSQQRNIAIGTQQLPAGIYSYTIWANNVPLKTKQLVILP